GIHAAIRCHGDEIVAARIARVAFLPLLFRDGIECFGGKVIILNHPPLVTFRNDLPAAEHVGAELILDPLEKRFRGGPGNCASHVLHTHPFAARWPFTPTRPRTSPAEP